MFTSKTRWSLTIFAVLAVFGLLAAGFNPGVKADRAVECRFGVTVATWPFLGPRNKSVATFDLPLLGTGYYLDWGSQRSPTVPGFISYLRVISVSDLHYPLSLAALKSDVEKNPGALWEIGNEPDDRTGEQDSIYAEEYAGRFFELATIIRTTDPTAKIGFGTIIMATPLRIMYLQRAWDEVIRLAGSPANASALVDFWAPHGFILNEEAPTPANPSPWGSGIPLGFDEYSSLQEIINPSQMSSVAKFQERMLRYRQFMKDIGEQNKPLWLTEWGVLAPSQNLPNSTIKYYTIPEAVTAQFFSDTVTWMENQRDPGLGMAGDENRLFQKWYWYSVNDLLYHFGGTLIDPLTLKTTLVGNTYINYEPPAGTEPYLTPDLEPLTVSAYPAVRSSANRSQVDYRLEVRVRNNVVHNHLTNAAFSLYDESSRLLGSGSIKVSRCGGDAVAILAGISLSPGAQTFRVVVNPAAGADANPANNEKSVLVNLEIPKEIFAPLIRK